MSQATSSTTQASTTPGNPRLGPTLEIREVRGKFCIMAGKSRLGSCPTREKAEIELDENRAFYAYWAGSVSVSVENRDPVVIQL